MIRNTSLFSSRYAGVALFIALFGWAAPAFSDPCGTYHCQNTGVTFKENATNRTTYTLTAECDFVAFADGACPPNSQKTVTGTAWWDKTLKLAYENIHNTYTDEFLINTVSKCSQNPWTGPIDCTEIQRNIISNHPLPASPVTASQLSTTDKNLLVQQQLDAVIMIQAPFFLKPVENTQFEVPVSVEFKVRHLAQCQAGFRIQRKKSLAADDWEQIPVPNDWYNTDHREDTDGAMTNSTFSYFRGSSEKTGDYRINTNCRTDNALNSEWLNFRLTKTSSVKIVEPVEGQSFDKQELVTVRATHHPEYSIKFTFQWSPVPVENEWPATPVDVSPASQSCADKTGGETSCQYSFTEAGQYKVYAQYLEDTSLPVSSQSFKITDSNWKKYKIQPSTPKIKPTAHDIKPLQSDGGK